MQWWSELWLNEGFATWAGWLAVAHKFPEWQIWDQFLATECARAMGTDAMLSTHPIEIPIDDPKMIDQVRRRSGRVGCVLVRARLYSRVSLSLPLSASFAFTSVCAVWLLGGGIRSVIHAVSHSPPQSPATFRRPLARVVALACARACRCSTRCRTRRARASSGCSRASSARTSSGRACSCT